jgi:cbb3-type cytochrome oxidase subunit 3
MFDALALPGLAILVVGFLAYVWIAWLSDKKGRALNVAGDHEAEDSSSPYD